jgi:hypothetical protein
MTVDGEVLGQRRCAQLVQAQGFKRCWRQAHSLSSTSTKLAGDPLVLITLWAVPFTP